MRSLIAFFLFIALISCEQPAIKPEVRKETLSIESLNFNIGCLYIKPLEIEKINGNEHDGDYYKLRISNL